MNRSLLSRSVDRSGLAAALPAWVTARLIVGGALVMALYVSSRYQGVEAPLTGAAPGFWGWDAGWYKAIATVGYDGVDREALRFFPLLPLLGRGLGFLLGGSEELALVVVVNAAALVAAAAVHRLAVLETGDSELASRATWVLALFPAAFVLVVPYAESLAMATTALAFLAARSRRWPAASAVGLLAGLSRPLGAVLALPLALEAGRGWSGAGARERLARAVAVLSPLAGTGLYLAWVGLRFGDPLLPVRVQQRANLRGRPAPPGRTFAGAVEGLAGGDLSAALHLVWFAVFAGLLLVALRRWPLPYVAFAGATLAMSVAFSNLDSLERYCFSAFPFVLAAASVTPTRWERPVLAVATAGLVGYSFLAFLGPYVP